MVSTDLVNCGWSEVEAVVVCDVAVVVVVYTWVVEVVAVSSCLEVWWTGESVVWWSALVSVSDGVCVVECCDEVMSAVVCVELVVVGY